MSETHWFSTKVRLLCLIEPVGGTRYMDSVFLMRARDYDDAFRRALELGKSEETTYTNGDGQQVVWKLVEVVSLDQIRSDVLDGVEVYSEPVPLPAGTSIPFGTEFDPAKSRPTQSV